MMKVEVTREHWDEAIKQCNAGRCITDNCLMSVALSDHFKKPVEVGYNYASVNDTVDIRLSSSAMSLIDKFDQREDDSAPNIFPITVQIFVEELC